MSKCQDVLDAAVARGDAPFLVAMTADRAGNIWTGASGEAASELAAADDTVFRIYSMTKAVGAVAAMILADRGKLSFDDPVAAYLPEVQGLQVLDGWDGDHPRLRAPKVQPTLRHLATHMSGLAYDTWSGEMDRWQKTTDHPRASKGYLDGLSVPLMFEPGTGWVYGIGIDWLGRVVEAVDGRRMDRFLVDELFAPLGMADTACEVLPHMQGRLAGVWKRSPDGNLKPTRRAPPVEPEFYGMGHQLYSTARDYLTFLRMLLGGGAVGDVRILSQAAADGLLANAVGAYSLPPLTSCDEMISSSFELFPGTRKTHSLAGVRVEADVPRRRRAGAQGWAGILNTHWWIDPASDVAAVLMTQTLPFVEPRFMQTYARFEEAVYAGRGV